jgi:hypothetical protein
MLRSIPIPGRKPEPTILNRCDFLADANVWPHRGAIDVRQWLKNFQGKFEHEVAHNLLEKFLFYPDRMTRELLRSAVRGIMPHLVDFSRPYAEVQARWKRIAEQMLVVPVRGEDSSDADSGYHYVRLMRDTVGIPEERLKSAPGIFELLSRPSKTDPFHIIVFVDDFVGTGSQFIKLWTQLHKISSQNISFKLLAQHQYTRFFYCPLVATSIGIEAIKNKCGDDVVLCPSYVLGPEYNALHPESRIWRTERLQQMGPKILADIAERVGMPDTDGNSVDDWQGYGKLGLGLVLNDSMPDACLGVFRYSSGNWHPLFNKAG